MDYEKKYKEALGWIQSVYPTMTGAVKEDAEHFFTELKESEDEKIRKNIIATIHLYYGEPLDDEAKEMIAWLEKQGQTFTKKDVDDAYLEGVTNTKNEIEKEYEATYQIRKDIATFILNYKGDIKDRAKWMNYLGIKVSFVEKQGEQKTTLCDKCKKSQPSHSCQDITALGRCALEKQGEQKSADKSEPTDYNSIDPYFGKPIDKVESKFKVGDKIYLKPEYRMPDDDTPIANTVFEIRAIDDKHYRFDGSYIFIEDQDNYELVEQKPVENKGMNLVEEEMTPFQKKVFCIIDTTIEEEQGLKQVCDELLTLASNEIKQKPTTEIKSAEESLGIDSETYNKIVDECIYGEQKPADKIEPKFKVGQTIKKEGFNLGFPIVKIENGFYYNDMGDNFPFTDQDNWKLVEQKPAWSEEDENRINRLIAYFEDKESFTTEDDVVYANWLKSLKYRVHPQNKWKESLATADLENSLCDIQDGFSDTSYEYRTLGEAIEFIRCTESKPHWKPSDEQIEALDSATENCAYSEYQDCLRELIGQLKKLREE